MVCLQILVLVLCNLAAYSCSQDVFGCGGFIKSEVEINFSIIEVKLFTKQGSLKYQTDCAPNNGYYMVPVYDKGDYVLRVEPPPGWTFEPQSVELVIDGKTDKCSLGEDINFQFTGFGVVGKVVSHGETTGPASVVLTLKKAANNEKVQETTTTAGGDYVFEKVLPGEYVIEAFREPWLFDVRQAAVTVDRETGNAGAAITVSGYDVKGRVISDGEPVQGVHFVLFTAKTSSLPVISGCDSNSLADAPALEGYSYLCHVISGSDGTFTFASLPTRKYVLIPFYKGEHIKFDVVPSYFDLVVGHDSIVLPQVFQVAGFSVSGHVRTTTQGHGVVDARVIVDRKLQATTVEGGLYHLDSMKSGTYQVQIEAARMSFDVATVKVTPNTPHLPDMIAARFEVCGVIEMEPIVVQSRLVRVTDPAGRLYQSVVAGPDGKFCLDCKPGKYLFSVAVSESDAKAGLKLTPSGKEVTVIDAPIDGIQFVQYRAKISGAIHCLEENCEQLQVVLQAITRSEDQRLTETEGDGPVATFAFEGVVPGKYRVSVLNEQWCWKAKSLDIEVVDTDLTNVNFDQTGFMLSASLSHSILLNFSMETHPDVVGSFSLTKGVNKFCLTQPGIYHLTPVSCHQFEHDVYSYDTSLPSVLSLVATRHLVEGVITTQHRQSDIKISIKSGESNIEIGPLDDGLKDSTDESITQAFYEYRFSYWAKNGEKLLITAQSGLLLFYPPSVNYTVVAGKCLGVVAAFEGRPGVFINGQIHPPLEGVLITVTTTQGATVKELLTDDDGKYSVGPLDGESEYSVAAEKEGFTFSTIESEQLGHFKSFKLGRIHVQVSDTFGTPLSNVLLSLSGSGNYRRNSVTMENGLLEFTSLTPGDYYLRVMMKEYQFEPSSRLISVAEGDTVEQNVVGLRVEFSCYGVVTSLSGEAEPGVHVEAVSAASGSQVCRSLQEESKTELDGIFRIRGLQPGCGYIIRLKSGELNKHIERSTPSSKQIQVANGDITGINIIAFRRLNQMEISGNIIGNLSMEHIHTLKVYLYKETSQDSPVHSTSLGPTSFFYLPSVPLNNENYVLKLTSSLSHSMYDFTLSEVQFSASVPHQHFTLRFEPQRKNVDQDATHGSVMILPIALLVLFLGYNYQQIMPIASRYVSSIYNQSAFSQQSSASQTHRGSNAASTSDIPQIPADLLTDSAGVKKKLKAKKI